MGPEPILFSKCHKKGDVEEKHMLGSKASCNPSHSQLELPRYAVKLEGRNAAAAVESRRQLVSGGEVVRLRIFCDLTKLNWKEKVRHLNPDAADWETQPLITAALLASVQTCSREIKIKPSALNSSRILQ